MLVNMLTLEERMNAAELLSGISLDDLMSLANTVTQGLLKPNTREEANEAILQHSDSVDSLLSRKKVSRELIFKYLHWKKITTDNNLDKKSLVTLLKRYWEEQAGVNNGQTNNRPPPTETPANQCQTVSSSQGSCQLDPAQVDLLAHKFTEWYYQLINKDFLEGGNFALGPENFWNDATLYMRLRSSNGEEMIEEAEGNTAVVDKIRETKQQHKLYFSPNLSPEGVRGRTEPHGMVSVLVCGTLHQSAGVVVGLFEQIFNLIRDPLMNNSWKIKRSQLSLSSKSYVVALPTLSEGELTRPLLPIQNPD